MLIDTNKKRFLNKLRNGEHSIFGKEVVENIKTAAVSLPTAKDDWKAYETAVGHESVMYKQSPESLETKDIAAFDVERDWYWREMLRRLKFQPASLGDDVCKAADYLLHIMNKYGNVPQSNLLEGTGNIRKALQEFKSPEAKAAIALIDGFDKLVAGIEALNDSLHDLYDKRYIEREKIKELGKLVDYRKVVDQLFVIFLESVNASHRVNERVAKDPAAAAAIEQIRKQLAALFSQLQTILAHRKK